MERGKDKFNVPLDVVRIASAGDTTNMALTTAAANSVGIAEGVYMVSTDVDCYIVQNGTATAADEVFYAGTKTPRYLSGNISALGAGLGLLKLAKMP